MKSSPPESPAPLMLSVSGARGIVGESMTPAVAADFAAAFAAHLRSTRTRAGVSRVVLGRDSRDSGPALAAAAAEGLARDGSTIVDCGVVATPTVGLMVDRRDADGGLVVTASHNPLPWNGLKCLVGGGVAPAAEEAASIIGRFRSRDFETRPGAEPPRIEREEGATEIHVDAVLAAVDPAAVRAAKIRVVVDSVNGAGGAGARRMLERLGCDLVHLNAEPTGRFSHPPEPTREHLVDLAARTREAGAACGFAQDPDADRLAIVDEAGRYIGEEYTLVLAAKRALDLNASAAAGGAGVAANLSTSRMIDDLAARYEGVRVQRTPVGEANVVAAMRAMDAIIGGEGNGGVVYPPVCWVRDSLSAMALVLDLLAVSGGTLSQIVETLPRYCMIKRKFDLTDASGDGAARAIDRVAGAFPGARIDRADGVRIDFDDGWVHLRPSNTEPVMRLIAEAPTEARAETLIADVARAARIG